MLQTADWEMQIKGELTEAAFPKAKINENIPSHINKAKENLIKGLMIQTDCVSKH